MADVEYGGVDPVESQERRASNRARSVAMLVVAHVPFVANSFGVHVIVGAPPLFDFWPGTGLWIRRSDKLRGRGVRALITAYRKATR